jgi:hypothetical protein
MKGRNQNCYDETHRKEQAPETHKVMRCRGFHIFQTDGGEIVNLTS